MIGRQILTLVATLALVAAVLSAGLLPLNSTARALPTAGTDVLNVSGSTSIISVLGAETIPLTGTVTIERSDPRIEGGVEVVDTEIVAMELTGTSVTGPITIVESATLVSSGEIRSLQPPPDDFPASSFFDAFIVVAVPASPSDPLILHNEEPFRLVPTSGGSEVPLTVWPPSGVTYQDDPEPCIPLLPVLPAQVCVTSLSILLGELKPTPTNSPIPSNTPTPTVTPTPCPTGKVPADGGCGTPTATPTLTPTPIPTVTPTPCPTGKVPAGSGCGTPTATPTLTPAPIPPPNDDFADSELVAALPSTDHEDTTSATLEPGEDQQCAFIDRTVWYSFTPGTDLVLVADTLGSSYDTALAVYTGTSLETLSLVVCNDDGGPGLLSRVQFSATAGVTYYFQVGGYFGSSGHLDFNVAPLVPIATATPTLTPTPTHTPKPPDGDTDGDTILNSDDPDDDNDGCADVQELGLSVAQGGLRNPHNFWDFMDVYTGEPPVRDKSVSAGDIGGVVARFGTFRESPPTKEEAFAEALTPPADQTGYHPAFDRSGSDPEGNVWDLFPPDGSIAAGDIGAVVAQFGHTCA